MNRIGPLWRLTQSSGIVSENKNYCHQQKVSLLSEGIESFPSLLVLGLGDGRYLSYSASLLLFRLANGVHFEDDQFHDYTKHTK